MYYISRRKFNKEVKSVYQNLFKGFDLLNVIKNPEYKRVEHFNQGLSYIVNDDGEETIGYNYNLCEGDCSHAYKINKTERKRIIRESLAISLGFNSYHQYMKHTKFLKDIKALKKLEDAPYEFISEMVDNFENKLMEMFEFKEKMHNQISFITRDAYHNNYKKFTDLKYTEEDFYQIYPFVIKLSISKDEDIINNKESFEYFYSLCEEPDLYNKNVMEYFIDNTGDKYSFFKELKYQYQIFDVKDDIINMDDESYEEFYIFIKRYFGFEVEYMISLLRENKSDVYLDYMSRVNKLLN